MKQLSYLRNLLVFAYKHNPILALFPILTTFSILSELLAMMILLPLSSLATEQPFNPRDPIIRLCELMGTTVTPQFLILTFCGLFIVRITTNILSQYISLKYSKRVLCQLAASAFDNIVKRCHLSEIQKNSIGHYISLAGDESFRASVIIMEVHQLISISILASFYYVLICWQSPLTGIGIIFFFIFSLLLVTTFLRKTHRLGALQIQQSKTASSIFLDSLNGLRTVRSFLAEDYVVTSYRSKMQAYTHSLFKIDFINILIKFLPIAFLFAALIVVLTTPAVTTQISSHFSFAYIITIILFLMRLFPTIGQGVNILLRFIADAKAARDVTELLHLQQSQNATDTHLLTDKINKLSIQQLTFAYENCPPLFKELNIEFTAGNSYALVSPSGRGKSSLFNILALLSDYQQGTILINNQPITHFTSESIRKKILLVEQESVIFNDTILNNLTLGNSYSETAITTACQIACIEDFIDSLPDKLNFILHYQGQNISGGQRQRLGIARAILRDPDVLLLDEVTSALDEETKVKVIRNLLNHFKERIIVLISHDQSVIDLCDQCFNLTQI